MFKHSWARIRNLLFTIKKVHLRVVVAPGLQQRTGYCVCGLQQQSANWTNENRISKDERTLQSLVCQSIFALRTITHHFVNSIVKRKVNLYLEWERDGWWEREKNKRESYYYYGLFCHFYVYAVRRRMLGQVHLSYALYTNLSIIPFAILVAQACQILALFIHLK